MSGDPSFDREEQEARTAFDKAIASGRLSKDEKKENWAGHYMYMGKAKNGGDAFKHCLTRDYIG